MPIENGCQNVRVHIGVWSAVTLGGLPLDIATRSRQGWRGMHAERSVIEPPLTSIPGQTILIAPCSGVRPYCTDKGVRT